MALTRDHIGTAPVSYGIAGAHAAGDFLRPERLLASMKASGYAATELGPPGYFRSGAEAAAVFQTHGIAAIGAYMPLHLATVEEHSESDLEVLRQTCLNVKACNPDGIVILAGETSPLLKRHPARRPDEGLGLDLEHWAAAAGLVRTALMIVEDFGLRSSFHPHMCSDIESVADVDRLIELTGVSITLDTGHVAAAGGDPAECVARWGDRVDHVHVKDVEVAAVERARVNGELFRMALASRPLGAGDVDFDPLFQALDRAGYDGWLVIERDHDVPIGTPVDDWLPAVMSEQSANFRWLEERLALLPRRGATEMTISPTRS